MRTTFFLLSALLLAGCVPAKPITYLALAQTGSKGMQTMQISGAVAVARVVVPPAIDRLHFTTGTAPGALHVASNTQWAGPLGPMVRVTLAQDLAARLTGGKVLMPGDVLPPGGAAAVHVTIQDFMPNAAGTVTLQADWSVMAPKGRKVIASGRFSQTVPGAATPAAEARTMSEALGRLADVIAKALAAHMA